MGKCRRMSRRPLLLSCARYRARYDSGIRGGPCLLGSEGTLVSFLRVSYHSTRAERAAGNSRPTHRARFSTSRGIGTFPTGYMELIRRPQIPGTQEEEERRSTTIRERGRRLYVKWIRQRYVSSRWIAFPVLSPLPSPSAEPDLVAVFSEQDCPTIPQALPTKAPVALIASAKSRLIDEFRRRVARK